MTVTPQPGPRDLFAFESVTFGECILDKHHTVQSLGMPYKPFDLRKTINKPRKADKPIRQNLKAKVRNVPLQAPITPTCAEHQARAKILEQSTSLNKDGTCNEESDLPSSKDATKVMEDAATASSSSQQAFVVTVSEMPVSQAKAEVTLFEVERREASHIKSHISNVIHKDVMTSSSALDNLVATVSATSCSTATRASKQPSTKSPNMAVLPTNSSQKAPLAPVVTTLGTGHRAFDLTRPDVPRLKLDKVPRSKLGQPKRSASLKSKASPSETARSPLQPKSLNTNIPAVAVPPPIVVAAERKREQGLVLVDKSTKLVSDTFTMSATVGFTDIPSSRHLET